MNFYLNITFSKFIALIIILLAFALDFRHTAGGQIFMFTVPFVNFIITGKQVIDLKENAQSQKDNQIMERIENKKEQDERESV